MRAQPEGCCQAVTEFHRHDLGSRLQLAEAMGHPMATLELYHSGWGKGQSSGMFYGF